MLESGYKSKKEFLIYICYAKGFAMKNHKFNNFSLVLASFLFAVGGLSFANAVTKINGATLTGNNWIGNGNPNESNVTVTNDGAGSDYNGKNIFGALISNGANAANNTVKVTGTEITTGSIEAARVGGSSASGIKKVSNNSIVIKDSNVTASIWAGRANDNNQADVNYNTTQIENSTITHNQLRGGISWPDKGTADYNTLYIKDSTTIGNGSSVGNTFEITGGFTQDYYNSTDPDKTGIASYNQLIYDNVTTYTNNKSATIKYLFGGAGRSGEANNNRAFVRDLNKNIADSVTIQTYVVGGATWRPRSGGAEGNIAVAVGDSKIAGIYGGAVAFSNSGAATESTKGANKNLVILDLSDKGIVKENVYGGYIFDTSMGSTTGNAVYFKRGTVEGNVTGGNHQDKTGNTLILGDSTSTWGTRKAGAITGFESLNFNVLKEGSSSDAVLSLTGADSSNLDGVSIKFLDQGNGDSKEATITVGGKGGVGVNSLRDSGGGENGIKALSETIKYKQYDAKDEKIKVVTLVAQDNVEENLKRKLSNGTEDPQATYNIGTKYTFTYKDIDLTEANKKYYLINSTSSELTGYTNMKNYTDSTISGKGETITHWDGTKGIVIDAYQTNQDYLIDNASTFTRNLRGMFVSEDKKALYIASNGDAKENIGTIIGGDKFFTKFGQRKDGNTISVTPNGNLDLSTTTFDGGTGKNTLNVGKDENNPTSMNTITMKDVTNFDTINFYLPDPTNGDIAIKIAGGSNTNVSNSKINVYIDDVSKFTSGKIHLLKANNGQVISEPGTVKVKAQIGAIATAETNSLDLVYKGGSGGTSTNDQTKIFNEARLGALGALWQGQYLIANHLDRVIPDAFSELFPYAITESYDKRFNTGSHVDTRGFNANAGFGSKGTNSSGEFTMGPFLDYGFSNYDAYLDDGTHGDGKNYYIGGGFFGKQENNSGSYFEATFRIGQLVTEFNGDLTLNGVRENYNFDLKSTYYAFHAGLGKIYDLNANNNLDIYGRFFYTHIESADTTLNGTKTEFDAVQSKKIRLGFKDDYKFNENHAIYAGAAYEYEFDSKAGGRVLVLGSNAEMKQPSLRGSTGIGEIGYQYKKDETLKFDVGVKGYVGKQEGVSAQMAISIAF